MTNRSEVQVKVAHVNGRYKLLATILGALIGCGTLLATAYIQRQPNPDPRLLVIDDRQGDRPKDAAERNIPPRHIR